MMFVATNRRKKEGENKDDEMKAGFEDNADIANDEEQGYNSADQIIDINVGGKRFQTYNKTLERFPLSLLGDTERRNQFYNPNTGELFFDRHRPTFESILYYYQSGGIMARPPNIPIHIFVNELIFFDIGDKLIEKLQIDNGLKELQVVEDLPNYEPFKALWQFLENPDSSNAAKIFAILSVVIIVVSLIMFVIETLPVFAPKELLTNNGTIYKTVYSEHATWMFTVNTAVICWFTIEFILRLICCPNKIKFFLNTGNIIDFLSILPYYLSLVLVSSSKGSFSMLRVIRVLRVFKLSRHSRGLQILGNTLKASFNELMMLAFFLFVMILIFGSCVYYAEYKEPGTKFISIPSSFWWAIVTMTTVGYGDMHPVTFWGQIVGSMAVVCGVLTIALPVPVVVSNFEYFYTKERNRRKTEEARKEQAKSKQEMVSRENVNTKIVLLKNYAKSIKHSSTKRFSRNRREGKTQYSPNVSLNLKDRRQTARVLIL
uniref:Potassium channel homolog n=1 Tax=Polyorchis penicillatus TaxID=6091 RepID=Q26094_POLPE|nr:potassium channel homolog [Polyorchis penicillatus]